MFTVNPIVHYCSRVDKPAKVEALIELGADINKQDNEGCTALSWASRFEQTLNVMELINAGADANLADNNGNTPLMWAVKYGRQISTHVLLFNGAGVDVHKADNHGESPLDHASTELAECGGEDFDEGTFYDVYTRFETIVKLLEHAISISA